jgi:hypothetical protein
LCRIQTHTSDWEWSWQRQGTQLAQRSSTASRCDPRAVAAHIDLANLLIGQQRLTEAEKHLVQALKLE